MPGHNIYIYIYIYIHLKDFAWENQRKTVLYLPYSTGNVPAEHGKQEIKMAYPS